MSLTICWQTAALAFLMLAWLPVPAWSQRLSSLLLESADSVGAALMAALHRATAAATVVGFADADAPPELPVLVELAPEVADVALLTPAGDELDELLLLPQPATNVPVATIAANEHSFLNMDPPLDVRAGCALASPDTPP